MSGAGEADAAPAGDADPPVDAAATTAADAEAAAPGAKPAKAAERVRPAHVVPGPGVPSNAAIPAFVAAVHARDAAAARAAISPTFQGKANGRPMDREAQVRLLESFWTGFPDGAFAMEPTGGSGRYVITWTFQGTHGGMYVGVPPTGTPVAFSGFIVAVADKGGVTSLDWKWDTKVFTRAVLGPDQVGDLEVKDTFRDPSKRWQQEGRGAGRGQARRKGQGPGRQGQQQGRPQGQPQPHDAAGEPGQPGTPDGPRPPRQPGQPGPPGKPGEGKRRRRGKGPRPEGAPATEAQGGAAEPVGTAPEPASAPAEGSDHVPTPQAAAPSAAPSGPASDEPRPGDT